MTVECETQEVEDRPARLLADLRSSLRRLGCVLGEGKEALPCSCSQPCEGGQQAAAFGTQAEDIKAALPLSGRKQRCSESTGNQPSGAPQPGPVYFGVSTQTTDGGLITYRALDSNCEGSLQHTYFASEEAAARSADAIFLRQWVKRQSLPAAQAVAQLNFPLSSYVAASSEQVRAAALSLLRDLQNSPKQSPRVQGIVKAAQQAAGQEMHAAAHSAGAQSRHKSAAMPHVDNAGPDARKRKRHARSAEATSSGSEDLPAGVIRPAGGSPALEAGSAANAHAGGEPLRSSSPLENTSWRSWRLSKGTLHRPPTEEGSPPACARLLVYVPHAELPLHAKVAKVPPPPSRSLLDDAQQGPPAAAGGGARMPKQAPRAPLQRQPSVPPSASESSGPGPAAPLSQAQPRMPTAQERTAPSPRYSRHDAGASVPSVTQHGQPRDRLAAALGTGSRQAGAQPAAAPPSSGDMAPDLVDPAPSGPPPFGELLPETRAPLVAKGEAGGAARYDQGWVQRAEAEHARARARAAGGAGPDLAQRGGGVQAPGSQNSTGQNGAAGRPAPPGRDPGGRGVPAAQPTQQGAARGGGRDPQEPHGPAAQRHPAGTVADPIVLSSESDSDAPSPEQALKGEARSTAAEAAPVRPSTLAEILEKAKRAKLRTGGSARAVPRKQANPSSLRNYTMPRPAGAGARQVGSQQGAAITAPSPVQAPATAQPLPRRQAPGASGRSRQPAHQPGPAPAQEPPGANTAHTAGWHFPAAAPAPSRPGNLGFSQRGDPQNPFTAAPSRPGNLGYSRRVDPQGPQVPPTASVSAGASAFKVQQERRRRQELSARAVEAAQQQQRQQARPPHRPLHRFEPSFHARSKPRDRPVPGAARGPPSLDQAPPEEWDVATLSGDDWQQWERPPPVKRRRAEVVDLGTPSTSDTGGSEEDNSSSGSEDDRSEDSAGGEPPPAGRTPAAARAQSGGRQEGAAVSTQRGRARQAAPARRVVVLDMPPPPANGAREPQDEPGVVLERDREACAGAEAAEWAVRKAEVERQAEAARRERKRRRAEADIAERSQLEQEAGTAATNAPVASDARRLEDHRALVAARGAEEEERNRLRGEVRTLLEARTRAARSPEGTLRALNIPVEFDPATGRPNVSRALRRALLFYHPDRYQSAGMRAQVEAEEIFKIVSHIPKPA